MQTVTTPDGGTMVLLPLEEYEALVDAADLAAANAIKRRIDTGEDETVPEAVVRQLIGDGNPVRVWREYRGLSAAEMARRAGLSRAYVHQVETGKRSLSVAALKRVAGVLNVDLDDLVD